MIEGPLDIGSRPDIVECLERETIMETISERDIWESHGSYLYRAKTFVGDPFFYPVFRWRDYYSFSPFILLLKKGSLNLNSEFMRSLNNACGDVALPGNLIDSDIERIGSPPRLERTIKNDEEFAAVMAAAMQKDVERLERLNMGKTNVILCGGKDSLNLLLLNWQNPVIVYSAEPNYPLVRQFVESNGLGFETKCLLDIRNDELIKREISEAFCLVELENWKWCGHLTQISNELNKNAVFWKGQFADAFLTDYWRSYTSSTNRLYRLFRRIYRKAAHVAPLLFDPLLSGIAIADYRKSIWERGAVLQGAHMGFLRSITDCLFVSGYHGPETAKVWTSADLRCVTGRDIRPLIGRVLAGKEVQYPFENPSPPASEFRKGRRTVEAFSEAVQSFGVKISRPPNY